MKPIVFPEANWTLKGNGVTVEDMVVYTDGLACVSIWELSEEDIKELIQTRKLYLTVFHSPNGFPPVGISTEDNIPKIPIIRAK